MEKEYQMQRKEYVDQESRTGSIVIDNQMD
jgi:hypothetical protein